MQDEWNLSDKIEGQLKTLANSIPVEDVKEFIRRLKEISIIYTNADEYGFHQMQLPIEIFDKLAGEKLK